MIHNNSKQIFSLMLAKTNYNIAKISKALYIDRFGERLKGFYNCTEFLLKLGRNSLLRSKILSAFKKILFKWDRILHEKRNYYQLNG